MSNYKPSWKKFEESTKELLHLCGLDPSSNEKIMGRQTDIWCKSSDRLLSARIIVECKSTKVEGSTVSVSDVTDFCNRLSLARSSGVADIGWMVTNGEYSSNAYNVVREAHLSEVCKLLTFKDLLNNIIDFSSYYAQLRLSLPEEKIGFIDPPVSIISPNLSQNFKSLLECCSYWVSDEAPEVLLLLGDYGQGKTTCCYQLLKMYMDDNSCFGNRIPIYVRLRDVANQGYQLSAIFRVCLQEQFGLNYHSFQSIEYLAKSGLLLLIFDGLDEVTYTGFWMDVYPALRQLLSISSPKSKILITSRPGIFSSGESIKLSFEPMLDENVNYFVAQVEYFDRERVSEAVRRYDVKNEKNIIDNLYSHEGIADLVRRPITLKMILDSLSEEQASFDNVSSSAKLYKKYTDKWLHRDQWRSNIHQLSAHQGVDFKRTFVQRLAWHMLTSKLPHVSADFIDNVVQEHFGHIEGITELLPSFANEIRLCSFLDWRLDGSLVFSHKSFFEYFVAERVFKLSLTRIIAELSDHIFDPPILSFLSQMIGWNIVTKSDLYDKAVRTSSIFCYNLLNIKGEYGDSLEMTVVLPNSAEIKYRAKDIIVLTVRDSNISQLHLETCSSLYLELINVKVEKVYVQSKLSTKLELRNSKIGELICKIGTKMELDGKNSKINGGEWDYQSLNIISSEECDFSRVMVDGVLNINLLKSSTNDKLTKEQRLSSLGFINKRRSTNRSKKRNNIQKNIKAIERDKPTQC